MLAALAFAVLASDIETRLARLERTVLQEAGATEDVLCDLDCQAMRTCVDEGTVSARLAAGSLAESDAAVVPQILRDTCVGGMTDRIVSVIGMFDPMPAPATTFPSSCSRWTSPKKVALVHVPRSAGGTMSKTMYNVPMNWTEIHSSASGQMSLDEYDIFIVATRDPIARFISAFNFYFAEPPYNVSVAAWTGPNALGKAALPIEGWNATRNPGMLQQAVYSCFSQLPGGVNAFAEALERPGTCGDLARRLSHEEVCDTRPARARSHAAVLRSSPLYLSRTCAYCPLPGVVYCVRVHTSSGDGRAGRHAALCGSISAPDAP